MDDILGIFIPIIFIIMVGLVTKWLSDNRLKRELAHASPELAETLLTASVPGLDNSLKWGIVSVGVGLALVVLQFMHLDERDPLSFGLIFIFGGAGLLLHYAIASSNDRDA